MSDAQALLDTCRKLNWRVGTAESCTGGMLGAALTDLPGSSDIYEGGFITYSNIAKTRQLGVRPESLAEQGAVSEQVAGEMAKGVLKRSRVDLAVAITGIAGPGSDGDKPEGLVCFGLATADNVAVESVEFGALGRDKVRRAARDYALGLLKTAAEVALRHA